MLVYISIEGSNSLNTFSLKEYVNIVGSRFWKRCQNLANGTFFKKNQKANIRKPHL
jgi:hypothetical protein